MSTWADPDGKHRGHVPPPNQCGWQRWSDRVGFVSLAGCIPKCTKTSMKSHKTACVMSKIISGRGAAPEPTGRAYATLPSRLGTGERVNSLPRQSPPQRLRRLASSSSATQVQCAPPPKKTHTHTIFWIRPWMSIIFVCTYRCAIALSRDVVPRNNKNPYRLELTVALV